VEFLEKLGVGKSRSIGLGVVEVSTTSIRDRDAET